MDGNSYVLAMEEIAKVDASAAVMSVNNSLVCAGLEKFLLKNKNKVFSSFSGAKSSGAFYFLSQAGSDTILKKTTAIDMETTIY